MIKLVIHIKSPCLLPKQTLFECLSGMLRLSLIPSSFSTLGTNNYSVGRAYICQMNSNSNTGFNR